MNVIKVDGGLPIFSWCQNLDQNAMEQMVAIAELPYVKHCAIMPDGHLGQNCCIGGVVACENIIVPDFIGSDCGCGLIVQKTSLKRSDLLDRNLRIKILNSIKRSVPMGFEHNSTNRQKELQSYYQNTNGIKTDLEFLLDTQKLSKEITGNNTSQNLVLEQIGTLGSGNHFLSIEYDKDDYIWIMVHSGSRNIGYKINEYYNEEALKLNQKWCSQSFVPFLPVDSDLGKLYLQDLNFALAFAQLNRELLVTSIMSDLSHFFPDVSYDEQINIHHNYASFENVYGKDLWVHRKGAVNASIGTRGVIPASMGTGSYIVEGK